MNSRLDTRAIQAGAVEEGILSSSFLEQYVSSSLNKSSRQWEGWVNPSQMIPHLHVCSTANSMPNEFQLQLRHPETDALQIITSKISLVKASARLSCCVKSNQPGPPGCFGGISRHPRILAQPIRFPVLAFEFPRLGLAPTALLLRVGPLAP